MAIDIQKFIGRFVEEARDHLSRLGEGLAQLQQAAAAGSHADAETVNALFRSAHTIKGSSRMLRLTPITELAHATEDVLGALRDGSLAFSPALGALLYRSVDHLASQVDALAQGTAAADLPPAPDGLKAELARALTPAAADDTAPSAEAPPENKESIAARADKSVISGQKIPENKTGSAPVAPENEESPISGNTTAQPRLKTAETVRVRLDKLDALIKLMGEVVASHARMRQRVQDVQQLQRELADQLDEAGLQRLQQFARALKDDAQAQEAQMGALHDRALIMRMLPLGMVLEPAARLVRELGQSVGKQVQCSVSGTEIELDRQLIDQLADPIIHLIRNAVDHGIESAEQRQAAGKPALGQITIRARQDGGWVAIDIQDDGAGIPLQSVRDKAVKKGLLSAEKAAAMSDQEVVDLIFLPGLSTSNIITDLSGRGVGMDVVKQTVLDALQGSISVTTQPGQGTTFGLRLPMSLAMLRVLLVQAQGLPFGFTAQYVAELMRLPSSALLQVAQRQAVIVRNEFVPVVALAELLQLPAPPRGKTATRAAPADMLLVVLQVRHDKIALRIDSLLDERDMVIQPLPAHLRHLPWVAGMVTTGSNDLVSVLHTPALLEQARRLRQGSTSAAAGSAEAAAAPGSGAPQRVLVVDDSLNTREIEKDVLQAYGYEVTLAEDGVDGLRKALHTQFDAILTDVEMPHMDGFTLTAQLREHEQYRQTPIIIITSREKEEDKRRGMLVGADAYIVKGDFDQSNLVDTLRALLG